MSLQFIFGNSGSGKSGYLYQSVLEQAKLRPEQHFLVIVPEQFTMQTQRELVRRQENHAIMNVDVLSFARLAYRVFDELGKQELTVLEETGKNLVLRRVAETKKKELTVLGGNLNKMGYISEMKSLISELAQYNITPEDLEDFLRKEAVGETLTMKMQDVLTMYRGFREYMEGTYITAEEVLALLCEVAEDSALLRGSVIVFDEFTGFTPIQNRLMRELLRIAKEVLVSVTIDTREDFYRCRGVHELFAMSKKTVEVLQKTAVELHVELKEPVILTSGEKKRYKNAAPLFFMEQNLFRPSCGKWEGEAKNIRIAVRRNPREELIFAAREMTRLVREGGYRYKDMALVTGDVPQYANYVPEIFEQYGIPYFIDQTRNILFHPFIELIRAALSVVEYDFSYESIFRFLRSGLAGTVLAADNARLTEEEIDRLENYVLAKGICGRRRWEKPWTYVLREETKEDLQRMNRVREGIWDAFSPLFAVFCGAENSVENETNALYRFICALDAEEQLKERELLFQKNGNPAKAKEYAQIYRIVMELFDKITALLGEEKMKVREYGDILDAGFEAAKVGIIPPGNDRVTVGDMERTRLNHIRVLFFAGVNEGIVPKAEDAGGIISQFERERMAEHRLLLAPGAREKVFIQKFYLYLNLTKPSDGLYVTFSKVNPDGKALRRSYLIGTLLKLFPEMRIDEEEEDATPELLTPENSIRYFVEGLRQETDKEDALLTALANWYFSKPKYKEEAKRLIRAAETSYAKDPVSRAVTKALYGNVLENSVTRLERFAACAFAHYMSYGLHLKERELFAFADVDMGNIYHDALEHFADKIRKSDYTWFDVPEQVQEQWIAESMEDAVLGAQNPGVFEEAANRYLLERMRETMRRTVWALMVQVRKGRFVPSDFEVSFSGADDLEAIRFTLGEEEKMQLRGRIDRVDTYETEDQVYVKIIDYKSGNTAFSLLNLYHGLQLQLVVYLNAALELTEKKHPGKTAEPAGIFYYHIDNPMVDGNGTESEEEIRGAVLEQLRLNGLVNDDPNVYRAMDTDFSGSSAVIPVALKADGTLKAVSKTAGTGDFRTMSAYVNQVLVENGRKILAGDVSVRPYRLDGRTGCDYCPYHTVCGFDPRMPGYSYRKLEKFDDSEAILERMREHKEKKG